LNLSDTEISEIFGKKSKTENAPKAPEAEAPKATEAPEAKAPTPEIDIAEIEKRELAEKAQAKRDLENQKVNELQIQELVSAATHGKPHTMEFTGEYWGFSCLLIKSLE
jgi:hypothetical protein